MNCQIAIELLPWLLNGTLETDERRQLLEHLGTCPECRAELARTREAGALYLSDPERFEFPATSSAATPNHPSAADLVAYAEGLAPSGLDRRTLEDHLASCPTCSEELSLVRGGRTALFGEPVHAAADGRTSSDPSHREDGAEHDNVLSGPWSIRRWRGLAAAASLAFLVSSTGWIVSSGGGAQPLIASGSYEFVAPRGQTRTIAEEPQQVRRSHGEILVLTYEPAAGVVAETAKLELLSADGEVLTEIDHRFSPDDEAGTRTARITLQPDWSRLAPGTYTVRVTPEGGGESADDVMYYDFRLIE